MSKKPMWGAALAAALIAGGVYTAPSAAAASGPEHCVIVLEKLEPGQAESEVAAKECADSKAELKLSAPGARAPLAKLFTLYDERNFGGSTYEVVGEEPCDSAGYRYRTLGWTAGDYANSIRLHSNCNTANLHEHVDYGGAVMRVNGEASDLGYLNDRVSSVAIWHS